MALEMNTDKVICPTCGTGYSKRKGFFPVSYGELYKGLGYIPYCRSCIDKIYSQYLAQCKDSKMAVRQTCRKLDLYWNESIFDSVVKKSSVRSLMTQYIVRINSVSCAGKSYDDTLLDEGILWSFDTTQVAAEPQDIEPDEADESNTADEPDIPQEVIAFWGTGYSKEMYEQLEQRRKYYSSKFPDAFSDAGGNDIGSDVLMRQLCNLEVSISKDAAAGKSIDKSVNSLNTLIGSLNLKPAQKKSDELDASMDCMAEQKQVGDSSVKDFSGMIGISSKFAVLNRLITRDLNNNTTTPTFSLYSKEDVQGYLANPYTYEKQIRNAVTYIYGASSHFRRIIQYCDT